MNKQLSSLHYLKNWDNLKPGEYDLHGRRVGLRHSRLKGKCADCYTLTNNVIIELEKTPREQHFLCGFCDIGG